MKRQIKSAEKNSWVSDKIIKTGRSNNYAIETIEDLLENTVYKYVKPKDGIVLDIGCGSGDFSSSLISRGYQTIGIDISFDVIKLNRVSGEYLKIVCDAEYLPFKKNSISACLCVDIFHHFPELVLLSNSLRNVLKKNGYVISIDPNKNNLHTYLAQEKKSPVRYYYLTPNERSISAAELYKVLNKNFQVKIVYYFAKRKFCKNKFSFKVLYYKTIGFILPQVKGLWRIIFAIMLFNIAHFITQFLPSKYRSNVVIGIFKKKGY